MRFLILTYSYPPMNNPRAVRWRAIAEYWSSQGHQVDVVSGWRPGLAREEALGGVRIRRVGGNVIERIRAFLRPPAPTASKKPTNPITHAAKTRRTWRHWFRQAARWCHDATWKKLYWPDSNCLWYLPAVKAAEGRLREHGYDGVISVSIPFTSHLVAHRLRPILGEAAWLVDVGDPFSFLDQCPPNNRGLYRSRNFAWEQRVFQAATAVSVTSDETAERYRNVFSDAADRIHVIPPLATQPRGQTVRGGGPTKLVYTGTLYRNIRNPAFLLELFGDLLGALPERGLELHLCGLVNDCGDIIAKFQERFGTAMHVHGVVPSREAQRAVAEADVLINLGNSTNYQLPSKIVDYAATGKPLLNLVTIDDDSSAAVLASHPSTLTVHRDDYGHRPQTVNELARVIGSPPPVDQDELEQWLARFTIDEIANRYMELVAPPQAMSLPAPPLRKAA